MGIISIGAGGPCEVPPIKGTVPINATFQQYIPIVDEDGIRISLTNYSFELAFRDRTGEVMLLLSTAATGITKTTDADGDILLVSVAPSFMSDMDGAYRCTFSAQDTSDVVYILAAGTVVFSDDPAEYT